VEKCGDCGHLRAQQLLIGLPDDEVEDEGHQAGLIEITDGFRNLLTPLLAQLKFAKQSQVRSSWQEQQKARDGHTVG